MARPRKEGLDYFPLDVDFDNEMLLLLEEYGNDALGVMVAVWQSAYKSPTGSVDLKIPGMTKLLQKNSRTSPKVFEKIINSAKKLKLIDSEAHEKSFVLTANGIRKRFDSVQNSRARWREYQGSQRDNPVENGADNPVENHRDMYELSSRESKAKQSKEEIPPPSPHGFDQVLAAWRSVRERESGKVDSLTSFEIQQLNGKFWGHGPEKLIAAIEGLGRLHFHATIDQIERWLKGEKFDSQKRTGAAAQTQGPKTPAFKPKPKPQAAVTAAEAFAEEQEITDLPF